MKKKLAKWLVAIAKKIDPQKNYKLEEQWEPVQLGIGYEISKSDVRKYRKENPQYDSHRKGMDALIEDTKQVIAGNIAAGMIEKGLLSFKVNRTLWSAKVRGRVVVYKQKEDGEETNQD